MTKKEYTLIYNECKKVRNYWVKVVNDDTLRGYCSEVSEYLSDKLFEKYKIDTVIIIGDLYFKTHESIHFWLEYKGYIIDLTATQFNCYSKKKYPNILIEKKSKLKEYKEEEVLI